MMAINESKLSKLVSTAVMGICASTLSAVAHASSGPYQLQISRVQGDLQCEVNPKDTQKSKCSLNLARQTNIQIDMNPSDNGGYLGLDNASSGTRRYSLVLTADKNQKLQNVMLITDSSLGAGQTMDLTVAMSDTNQLHAVNVDPMQVKIVSDQEVDITMSFIYYAPGDGSLVKVNIEKPLTTMLMEKIIPVLQLNQR